MDRKQKKTLLTLLGIIVALLVLLLLVLALKARSQEEEAASPGEGEGVITEQQAFSALSYWNGSATLSFQVDENGAWFWADDPDFPLDGATVTAIADLAADLTPQQTITEGDTLEAYGLDDPSATLDAVGSDGSTLSLTFGKTTTDGTSYYMLMNGQESPVYIVADTLVEQMGVAIYDMCALPALPVLTEDRLETVTLSSAAGRVRLTARQSDEATTWTLSGEDVTGDADVTALVSALGTFALEKCVDFKPTDQAATICGFDAPTTVTVAYLTEAGTEETFTLYVGTATLDATGYYLRLNEDTTIYQASTDAVTALLGGALLPSGQETPAA